MNDDRERQTISTSFDCSVSSQEELRLLRIELVEVRQKLADALFEFDSEHAKGSQFKVQLHTLRNSMSWRLTRPMREIGKFVRAWLAAR